MKFSADGAEFEVQIERLIVAGWTGRDRAAVDHHIEELAVIGVAPPSEVPLYYKVSNALLTQASEIQVLGETSSGEVEPLLIKARGEMWLGLGSDQTDRELEAVSVAASKQACLKPVSREVWRFSEVAPHLDQLILQCEIEESGKWVTYQEGTLASIQPLPSLAERVGLRDGDAMLCGTLGAKGGVRPALSYRMRLRDPVLERELALDYSVTTLPVVD